MIPSERRQGRSRATRTATWALLLALGAGCSSTAAPDEVPTEPSVEAPEAPEAADPSVPSFGTDADSLDAAVVSLTPAGEDGLNEAVRVDARVAADPDDRREGLMGVELLPDGAGMLFVFAEEHAGAFWMKDTLVPLDIAFIAPDGTVRAVLTMEPCTADPCPVYDPEVEYLTALEVPAGWFAANDIDVGATASWSEPVPSAAVSGDAAGQ